jgi:DNA-binding NarL/FixJ family response regulator
MDLIICFIDDSDFEHDLVRNEIARQAKGIEFVQAYTFDEAVEQLGNRLPGLFLLDLWGQDPQVKKPYITSKEELEEIISHFNTPEQVYKGLDTHEVDRINEYLKRLFSIVDRWRNLFETVCDRAGQNNKYGLANIRRVREEYPGIPAVFYTRKSLINDAVAMINSGTDGLFIKPTGKDNAETRRLTSDYAPKLLRDLLEIIQKKV